QVGRADNEWLSETKSSLCQIETVPICRKFVERRPAPRPEKPGDVTKSGLFYFSSCFTLRDVAGLLTADSYGSNAPAPAVPKPLTGPIASALTVPLISRVGIVVAGAVPVIGAAGSSSADDRADGKATDDAGRNSAAVTRFSRLRSSDGREPKGRGDRESG